VNLIVNSADFDGMALKVLQDTRHLRVGLDPNFLRMQERPPILRREDHVHNQVGKRSSNSFGVVADSDLQSVLDLRPKFA
jgi:hypothetical protein